MGLKGYPYLKIENLINIFIIRRKAFLFIIFILVIEHDTDSEMGIKHVKGFQPSGDY